MRELEKTGRATGRKSVYPNIAYDYQRKSFYVNFDYGFVRGKRKKMHSTYRTAREAGEALEGFLASKQQNTVITPDSITMEAYCKQWLSLHCASGSEATRRFYDNIINKHIIPSLGKKKVQSITTNDINAFLSGQLHVAGRRGKRLSPSTVKKHRDTLCTIFESAKDEELIGKNPALRSHDIIVRHRPIDAFTVEEVQKIIQRSIEDEVTPHSEAYRLAIYTGMRKGELHGLK